MASFFWSIFKKIRKTAVALCGAIFRTLEKHQKMPNVKKTNTYGQFFWINFQENPENGCGAMWHYFLNDGKTSKNAKHEGNQYIWPVCFNFQENPENGCGAMWRYFFNVGKTLKNAKHEGNQYIWSVFFMKCQKNPENGCGAMRQSFFVLRKTAKNTRNDTKQYTYDFFWPIFMETWKTLVALCGAIYFKFEKLLWKTPTSKETIYICQLYLANFHSNLENG